MIGVGTDENYSRFLVALYNTTGGDPDNQASMFDIGQALGLERDAASKTAEELIGHGWAAVKTLSGGIGITGDGITRAHQLGCAADDSTAAGPVDLGSDPILDDKRCGGIEQVVAVLKTRAGENSWDFETLTELMADLKTIDAQMISPRPKTAIVRECLRSIKGILKKTGNNDSCLSQVDGLLGE